jgi:hypothetical protein
MPNPCKCCVHPERNRLNKAILDGQSANSLAAEYGMSRSAIQRHQRLHLKVSAVATHEARNAATIVGYAYDLYQRAGKVLDRAEALLDGSDAGPRAVMAAAGSLREVRQSIELLARLVTTEAESDDLSRNVELDLRIGAALDALVLPALGSGEVADAELVTPQ